MRHVNIPVFIPHLGCPNDCIFCNQHTISGTGSFDITAVRGLIEHFLSELPDGCETELAYFGGSFTGIDRNDMRYLLSLSREYIDSGRIRTVRVSTRPDYIDKDVIGELEKGGVTTVELGVQSMSNTVLAAAKRGHSADDTVRAFGLLRSAGMNVVGQMMTGLPRSTEADEISTAEAICSLGACAARIYPLAVLRGTALEDMAANGAYTPLTPEAHAERAASVLEVFASHSVPVIRIGLCASEGLSDGIACGEYPPALGEMAQNVLYLRRIRAALTESGSETEGAELTVFVPRGCVSKACGQHGRNRDAIKAEFGIKSVIFREDCGLDAYTVKIVL